MENIFLQCVCRKHVYNYTIYKTTVCLVMRNANKVLIYVILLVYI